MPFPMKIQPIDNFYDFDARPKDQQQPIRNDSNKPMLKSRIKRLFDRQFPSVLKISSASEKLPICCGEPPQCGGKDVDLVPEFEPSSVCLAKMVRNFIEESSSDQKPSAAVKCGRRRCNCFNGNNNESSDDDEFDVFGSSNDLSHSGSSAAISEIVKGLIPCTSSIERSLLADTSKIMENNKIHKRKDELRKIVTDELSALGYNASICKSRWDKSTSYPAGEYEYIDVTTGEKRILIDIDFRSEFEIARSTSNYKSLLQHLPCAFVGKSDRLQQIVTNVSEAAKLSLTKRNMDLPPWRKAEYMIAKWLSPYTRTSLPRNSLASASSVSVSSSLSSNCTDNTIKTTKLTISPALDDVDQCGEFELIFGDIQPSLATETNSVSSSTRNSGTPVLLSPWQPPAIRPRSCDSGARIVTGLASLFKENS